MKKVYTDLLMNYVGEQANLNQNQIVTPDNSLFTLTTDASFLAKVDADKRTDKIIYAYTDSGVSENNRNWSGDIMVSIAGQVVTKLPTGYLGHIKQTEYGFAFPEPQVVWFGSYVEDLPTGGKRLWIKGYLLPTATDLQTWIGAKAVDSISVYGAVTYSESNGIKKILSIDLKSIDISRKLAQGLNSKIVGLAGEMADNASTASEMGEIIVQGGIELYALKDMVREKLKKHFYAELSKLPPVFNSSGNPRNPYVYVYCEKFYVGSNKLIVEVETEYQITERKLYDVDYSFVYDKSTPANIIDVQINKLTEVIKVVNYTPVVGGNEIDLTNNANINDNGLQGKPSILAEEMNNNGGADVDISNLTVNDIKTLNPTLFQSIRTAIASEMSQEQANQVLVEKAGEMDSIVAIVGEQTNVADAIKTIIEQNKTFAGEMAKLFCGEQAEEATTEQIVEKAEAVVAENTNLKETVDQIATAVDAKAEDGTVDTTKVVENVQSAITANQIATAKADIAEVQTKFDELSKGVTNEVVLEYVKDEFADILNADEKSLPANYKTDALAKLEAEFQNVVTKHTTRLGKLGTASTAVGEMNAFMNLGTSVNTNNSQSAGEQGNIDPDVALAKKLGY